MSQAFSQDFKGAVTGAMKSAGGGASAGGGDVAAGLKEALATGTGNAVQSLSKTDGYFGDAAAKILMPGKMQQAADVLKKAGYQREVELIDPEHEPRGRAGSPQGQTHF